MLNFFKNLSPTEIAIIALILIVFFGTKAIIGLGKVGGTTLKEIKKIKKNFTEVVEDNTSDKDKEEVSK